MDQNPQGQSATPKQLAVERIRQATNVLVTVRSNPTVDELAACIGLTLMLNKLEKHATAVFSGIVPSTIEFLKPEDTLEPNTDSLRDFIISLDKSKADKLRYKVEENVVRIFITPYRTSLSDKDLEFTQGDFNVDVVIALGVTQREELDQAIVSHGRILHDAAVVTLTAGQRESTLGTVNWQEPGASSLSEMLVSISEALQGGIIDAQMATAFLTGIVAETDRFSNNKTTPKVMTMAAQLMAAGANQQLIANELEKDGTIPTTVDTKAPVEEEAGALSIEHTEKEVNAEKQSPQPPTKPVQEVEKIHAEPSRTLLPAQDTFVTPGEEEYYNPLIQQPGEEQQNGHPDAVNSSDSTLPAMPMLEHDKDGQIHIDPEGNLTRPSAPKPKHKVIEPLPQESQPLAPTEPPAQPQIQGASTMPQGIPDQQPQTIDPLTLPTPTGQETTAKPPTSQPAPGFVLPTPASAEQPKPEDHTTLLDIEKSVHSPHLEQPEAEDSSVDSARNAVMDAINQVPYDPTHPEPRADVGAQFGPPIQPTPGQPTPLSELRLPEVPERQDDGATPPPPPVPPPMNL